VAAQFAYDKAMNTSMSTQTKTVIGIIIVILIALGAFLLLRHPKVPASGMATSTGSLASTTTITATSSVGSVSTNTTAPSTMTMIPINDQPKAPNYTKPLTFDASINASVRTAMQGQFSLLTAAIAKDANDFNAIMNLASLRLIGGDTAGAKEIWDYASTVWPTNKVSFSNLGNYYVNTSKNYQKAETNYLQAVKNDPTRADLYKELFDLYFTLGFNKNKAEAILKQGIAMAPKAIDLEIDLARYYRDAGRTTEAKAEYGVAITSAQSQGQTSLATSIQTELSAF
jgi:tetratricopeptide (TPR) repeat protein